MRADVRRRRLPARCRPGQRGARGGRHRGQGVGRGERRAAPDLPDRSVQRDPGPERDQQRDHPPEAAGRRLDHPHPARPGLHERPGAGRGRDPPAPRRVGQPQPSQRHHAGSARALRRRRRGEDDHQLPEGLRLPVPRVGHVAAQPHDPQPHAGADPGLHGLRDRLHPARPRGGRAASGRCTPIWMDVQKGSAYPVFDVQKGSGRGGRYTYPDDEPNAYGGREAKNEWVADRDGVLVATGGHLHPGGLFTDLYVRRRGARIRRAAAAARTRRGRAGAAARTRRAGAAPTPTCSARRPSTSSRRERCPGTWR